MRKLGYLRVSTCEQRPDRQIDALEEKCDQLFIDTASAANRKRPVFNKVLRNLKEGDALVILDLDRAFRSVVDAVQIVERLQKRGVSLQIINLQIDTTTPGGMLIYTVVSAFAEFERRILSQRTKEGLAAAKKRGARLGRPQKLSAEQLNNAARKIETGSASVAAMAKKYEMSPWGLTRAIRRMN